MPNVWRRRGRLLGLAFVVLLVAAGTIAVSWVGRPWPGAPGGRDGGQAGRLATLQVATSTGRRGVYYLPRGYEARSLPLLVMLHGSRGKGSVVALRLIDLAEREGFIIVAPDSVSAAGAWLIGTGPHDSAEDHRHILGSVREVLALPAVRVDRQQVLVAGFSVAGGVAADIATREELFTAFAVLHGHVVLDQMGPRRVRAWLSTGDRDRLRTVEYIRDVADHLSRREAFPEVVTRVFRADHALRDEELAALVGWWLRREAAGRGR
jgi:poly(3-hydroxybutyrate) depolymerase